jgi:hypothetical protein
VNHLTWICLACLNCVIIQSRSNTSDVLHLTLRFPAKVRAGPTMSVHYAAYCAATSSTEQHGLRSGAKNGPGVPSRFVRSPRARSAGVLR